MKWHVKEKTLVIDGDFEALSSGFRGGRSNVKHILNSTVPSGFEAEDHLKHLEKKFNIRHSYFSLLTALDMRYLAFHEMQDIYAFVTAGIENPVHFNFGTINIIIISKRPLSEGALVNCVITATEAKTFTLFECGFNFSGTSTDAVVVAYERSKKEEIEFSGPYTRFGREVVKSVRMGIRRSLKVQRA
ncbi:MAG: Adenosylcobinamide amidohydrolase [Candidatus Methanolliviera sp. GoM_oil]|nr:MAG: Adenosylcobinamide amidohydrolase [Candidatus Methanolliviera sp. GoM_oil]